MNLCLFTCRNTHTTWFFRCISTTRRMPITAIISSPSTKALVLLQLRIVVLELSKTDIRSLTIQSLMHLIVIFLNPLFFSSQLRRIETFLPNSRHWWYTSWLNFLYKLLHWLILLLKGSLLWSIILFSNSWKLWTKTKSFVWLSVVTIWARTVYLRKCFVMPLLRVSPVYYSKEISFDITHLI